MESKIPASAATVESHHDLAQRLRLVGKTLGSNAECARRANIPIDSFNDYLDGTAMPAYRAAAVARVGGVSVDWLLGEGPRTAKDRELEAERLRQIIAVLEEGPPSAEIAARITQVKLDLQRLKQPLPAGSPGGLAEPLSVYRPAELSEQGYVLIPRYDVQAAAGPGAFSDGENIIDYMAFQADWVRRALGIDPARLVLITAVGDSMEPTIRSGDLLLVDRSVAHVQDDAIYVVARAGDLVVKRLQRFFRGAVVIRSDNTAYVEETLDSTEAAELRIAGRVRWIARMI